MHWSFRPASFLATSLCFLLPFMLVSCPGGKTVALTGVEMAVGTSKTVEDSFGQPKSQHISAEPLASVALVCAVVGILVALGRGSWGRTASIAVAAVGGIALIALQVKVRADLQGNAGGLATVEFNTGYWSALLGYLVALVLGMLRRQEPSPAVPEVSGTPIT